MLKALIASLLLLSSSNAFATPVTYAYEGVITNSNLSGTGPLVEGTFTFDDALNDLNPSNTTDDFRGPGSPGLVFSATFNSGSLSVTLTGMGTLDDRLFLSDEQTLDQLFFSVRDSATSSLFRFGLLDQVNFNLIADGFGNLTGTPLDLTTLLLSSISRQVNFFQTVDADGNPLGRADFRIDSISAVPLPAAAWLFITALGGLFGFKRLRRA